MIWVIARDRVIGKPTPNHGDAETRRRTGPIPRISADEENLHRKTRRKSKEGLPQIGADER